MRASRVGADPLIVEFERKFVKALKAYGIPFFAHEFVRDEARQNEFKERGVSRAAWGQSAHNFGCAVDIIHSTRGWQLSELEWNVIGLIGQETARKMNLKIKWGGDFKSLYDPAHWELEGWENVAPF